MPSHEEIKKEAEVLSWILSQVHRDLLNELGSLKMEANDYYAHLDSEDRHKTRQLSFSKATINLKQMMALEKLCERLLEYHNEKDDRPDTEKQSDLSAIKTNMQTFFKENPKYFSAFLIEDLESKSPDLLSYLNPHPPETANAYQEPYRKPISVSPAVHNQPNTIKSDIILPEKITHSQGDNQDLFNARALGILRDVIFKLMQRTHSYIQENHGKNNDKSNSRLSHAEYRFFTLQALYLNKSISYNEMQQQFEKQLKEYKEDEKNDAKLLKNENKWSWSKKDSVKKMLDDTEKLWKKEQASPSVAEKPKRSFFKH